MPPKNVKISTEASLLEWWSIPKDAVDGKTDEEILEYLENQMVDGAVSESDDYQLKRVVEIYTVSNHLDEEP